MNVATGISEIVSFQATPEELQPSAEKLKALQERVTKENPIVLGTDVIGDIGAKIHFIGEPIFQELGDTLIKCTLRVKITLNSQISSIVGFKYQESDFYGWAKCSETDKEQYDYDFGCRIALNKVKIKAYSYYQRMFVRIVEKMFRNIVMMVGFTKNMENLVNSNANFIHRICEKKYPKNPSDTLLSENPVSDAQSLHQISESIELKPKTDEDSSNQ